MMIAKLITLYAVCLFVPFGIAVVMPNVRCLMAYLIVAAVALIAVNGDSEYDGPMGFLGYLLTLTLALGSSAGIAARMAGLMMRARGYSFPHTHIPAAVVGIALAVMPVLFVAMRYMFA